MKPLIGITCNYDYRDTVGMTSKMGICGQDWNFVAGDYIYGIEKAGGLPVLIPRYENIESIKSLLDTLDGVLISGGHDVDPGYYGAFPKKYCGTIIPMRDAQDIAITKYALERKMPLLGVCRGIQVLNVACGGSLYQDLEKEGGYEHHFGDKFPRNIAWHSVSLEKDSQMQKIFGTKNIQVNSYHHQAVLQPGNGVKITGYSSDGVPEAIELEELPFAMAVQWHPEMMYDSEQQQKLLQAFVDSCR